MKNRVLPRLFVVFLLVFTAHESFAQDSQIGYVYTENGLHEVPVRQDVVLVYFSCCKSTWLYCPQRRVCQ